MHRKNTMCTTEWCWRRKHLGDQTETGNGVRKGVVPVYNRVCRPAATPGESAVVGLRQGLACAASCADLITGRILRPPS